MSKQNRAERIYDRLLRLYPTAYRQRFGKEMRQNFRDLYREQKAADQPSLLFWGRTLGDLSAGVITQHVELIRSPNDMFQYIKHSRPLQFLLASLIALAAFSSWQFAMLQHAHSTFDNYAAFRGCAHITSQSANSGACTLTTGQSIKMVKYNGQWYLDGDLPLCWRNFCL